jgi:hypothetical protein
MIAANTVNPLAAEREHRSHSALSATLPTDMALRRTNGRTSQTDLMRLLARVDRTWTRDELGVAWRTAQDDATCAYRAWCKAPGPRSYAAYRAAQDRADTGHERLAAGH